MKRLKEKGESFSDIIEKLLDDGLPGTTSRLMKHFGVWKDLPEDFKQIIQKLRESSNNNIRNRVEERLDDISR